MQRKIYLHRSVDCMEWSLFVYGHAQKAKRRPLGRLKELPPASIFGVGGRVETENESLCEEG